MAVHLIICDGESLDLLLREIWGLYSDLIVDHEVSPPALPLQYADYAVWQRNAHLFWLHRSEDYWNKRLAGAKGLKLPIENGLKNVEPFKAAPVQISLDEALTVALHNLARSEKTVPAMVVLALGVAAISRWCNQNDFLIATIVSGRDFADCEKIIGMFATGLLLRIELSGNETFLELINLVVREFLTAWEHREFGTVLRSMPRSVDPEYGALIEWVPWERRHDELIATIGNTAPASLKIRPFCVKTGPQWQGRGLLAIELFFFKGLHGISSYGYYRADLFSPEAIERFSRNFELFSARAVENPQSRVTSLYTEHSA
jgi:hypothetical protein